MFTFVLKACALRIYPTKGFPCFRILVLVSCPASLAALVCLILFGFGMLLRWPLWPWSVGLILLGLISTRSFLNVVLLSMLYPKPAVDSVSSLYGEVDTRCPLQRVASTRRHDRPIDLPGYLVKLAEPAPFWTHRHIYLEPV